MLSPFATGTFDSQGQRIKRKNITYGKSFIPVLKVAVPERIGVTWDPHSFPRGGSLLPLP